MGAKEIDGQAPGFAKRTLDAAYQGMVGNAAWAGLLVVVVIAAAFLEGSVPGWLCLVAVGVTMAFGGFVAASANRRAARLEGERDEARRQRAETAARLTQVEADAERSKGELRDQLAAAAGGQVPVSARMQTVVRKLQALRRSSDESPYPPKGPQVELLVAIAEELEASAGADPITQSILGRWRDDEYGHSADAWRSALEVLEAHALSIGSEEALGGSPGTS